MLGTLHGLKHQYEQPLQYFIRIEEELIGLNNALGKELTIQFAGEIKCIHCGRKINKTFNSGYCYPCFKSLPENDLCIVKPHECHFENGTCRDADWAQHHCMIPHYVYLAVSSDIKVGLTRKGNQLKRWGDQGAVFAVPVAELPNRKLAGELEFALSQHLPDKTNWRKMLKGEFPEIDLYAFREELKKQVPEPFHSFLLEEEEIVSFTYPQLEGLEKISAYNLDKSPVLTDRLIGIKGQYLIFEQGVLNVRKYSGYKVQIEIA